MWVINFLRRSCCVGVVMSLGIQSQFGVCIALPLDNRSFSPWFLFLSTFYWMPDIMCRRIVKIKGHSIYVQKWSCLPCQIVCACLQRCLVFTLSGIELGLDFAVLILSAWEAATSCSWGLPLPRGTCGWVVLCSNSTLKSQHPHVYE